MEVEAYDQDDRQPKIPESNVTLDDKESVDFNSNTEIPEMKYSLWELYCMVNCAGVYDSICCKTISHTDIPHSKYQQAIIRTVKKFSKSCDDEFKQYLSDNDDGDDDTFRNRFRFFLLEQHR